MYGLSEVCVRVWWHAYTYCRHVCSLCIFSWFFFFCESMWRMIAPGLDGGVLAPSGLLKPASAQDQGVQGLLPHPASLTARQLQSPTPPPHPWQAAPLPFSLPALATSELLVNLFYSCFLVFTPQDRLHTLRLLDEGA